MVGHMYGSRIQPPATPLEKEKMVVGKFIYYTTPIVWPPNSPDLNLMDYYVWGAVEKDANRCASTTKAQLINRIKTVLETLPRESAISAYFRYQGRIEAGSTLIVVILSETC